MPAHPELEFEPPAEIAPEQLSEPETVAPEARDQYREQLEHIQAHVEWARSIVREAGPGTIDQLSPELGQIEIAADVANEQVHETIPPKPAVISADRREQTTITLDELVESENPFQHMMAVRVAEHPPVIKDGRLMLETPLEGTNGDVARSTVHFTLNERVESHAYGTWDSPSFGILSPVDKLVETNGLPLGLGQEDTFWMAEKGISIPDGTVVLIRKDRKDERIENLKQYCQENKIDIEFREVDDVSSDAVRDVVQEKGLGNVPHIDFEADKKLRSRYGMTLGGRNGHMHSWISLHDEKFMLGNPTLESAVAEKNPRLLAWFTPANQLGSIGENYHRLPEGLRSRFEQIAVDRLQYIWDHPEKAQEYFRLYAEQWIKKTDFPSESAPPPAEQAEAKMYEGLLQELLNGDSEYATDIRTRRPELLDDVLDHALPRLDQPAYRDVWQPLADGFATLPEATRAKVVQFAADRSAADNINLMAEKESMLQPDEIEQLRSGIQKTMASLPVELGPRYAWFHENAIGKERAWYVKTYGQEFMTFVEQHPPQ